MPSLNPDQPLQSLLDPFVESIGGSPVAKYISGPNPPSNADYVFPQHNVIAELKTLEEDSFGEAYRRRMGELLADWQRRDLLLTFGETVVRMAEVGPVCQGEWLDAMAVPMQRVVTDANNQIKKTKRMLRMPNAKGLLLVASDGNKDLLPNDIWHLLGRVLGKKHPDGKMQYSGIDSLVYFNPRMPVEAPTLPFPSHLCFGGPRHPADQAMITFLDFFCASWERYMTATSNSRLQINHNHDLRLADCRFAGVGVRTPRI